VVLVATPIAAHAEDLPQGWSGKGQAGYVMSRGNSDTDSANSQAGFERGYTMLEAHCRSMDCLAGVPGITSAERWDARLQSDYQSLRACFRSQP